MRFSPGPLVAAAFIGPGTVTTATLAGARYGYVLLWGIVASAIATIVLQEMAMRIGVSGRRDLGTALREKLGRGPAFWAVATLAILAIGVGNAAYEGGNLAGAAVGAELLLPDGTPAWPLPWLLGAVAAVLLAARGGAGLRAVLTVAVVGMSLIYLGACVAAPVAWGELLARLARPRLPTGAEWTLIGLIGTTVVPYNLFLHAATARDFYDRPTALGRARRDLYASVGLGALITLAIATLAAAVSPAGAQLESGADIVSPLVAVLGPAGTTVVGLGYLAAGLTSAITAPLAAALAVAGLLAWDEDADVWRSRLVWGGILLVGLAVVATGAHPVWLILTAQVANGLLLPVIAALVLWTANDRALLGEHANGPLANVVGALVVALTLLLGGRIIYGLL